MGLTDIPLLGGLFANIPFLDNRPTWEKVFDKLTSWKVIAGAGIGIILLSKGGVLE